MDGSCTWVVGHTCDQLIHEPLTDDELNQISITFGIRPIKRVTFYCDTFGDIQLCVATGRMLVLRCADDRQ